MTARLPALNCECGSIVESDPFTPNARGGAHRASGYASCLRRCEHCGVGFSNANRNDPRHLTKILRDPFIDLPAWVACGSDSALDNCLNRAHAATKRTEFHSLRSEDHITWTVLRLLQREHALGRAFGHPDKMPDVLAWGAPVPEGSAGAQRLREKVIGILDRIGESARWRTEPDIILDFGDCGVIIIEAKFSSSNEVRSSDYGGWDKYANTDCFRDWDVVRDTGRYELVRNWRLGVELAGERCFKLVNLAQNFSDDERTALARLRIALRTTSARHFTLRTWSSILGHITIPDWFQKYAERRVLHL